MKDIMFLNWSIFCLEVIFILWYRVEKIIIIIKLNKLCGSFVDLNRFVENKMVKNLWVKYVR